jgi:hypothetical protein
MVASSAMAIVSMASRVVSANPVASPFDYGIEIAAFNFPINGFLLLGIYAILITRRTKAHVFGPFKFFFLFLACTGIISFTGGIVDATAYYTESLPVFLVATALIGMIACLVAYRYLKMDFVASWVVGGFFLIVNLISWTLLASDIMIDVAWDHCYVIWVFTFVFVFVLLVFSMKHQGGSFAEPYGFEVEPWPPIIPETPSEYPVKVPSRIPPIASDGLLVESLVVAGGCLCLVFYLSIGIII